MRGRVSMLLCGILVAILGFGSIHESGANAQERVSSAQPFRIALVDISYLFHKSRGYKKLQAGFYDLIAKDKGIPIEDLQRREIQNLVIVYGHIRREVRRYAEQHDISLVLKFESGRLPFNRSCGNWTHGPGFSLDVPYHTGVDITDQILKRLNQKKSDNIRPATQTH